MSRGGKKKRAHADHWEGSLGAKKEVFLSLAGRGRGDNLSREGSVPSRQRGEGAGFVQRQNRGYSKKEGLRKPLGRKWKPERGIHGVWGERVGRGRISN